MSYRFVHRRQSIPRASRSGVTALEFAFVSPILFAVAIASVALGGAVCSQNALTAACREGCRVASFPGTKTDAPVKAKIDERLAAARIDPGDVTITITPDDLDVEPGTNITVEVSVPIQEVVWILPSYLDNDLSMRSTMSYVKE